ncbi:MAG: SpoIIE family protein phosphatase [Bacteroidota bacterium]
MNFLKITISTTIILLSLSGFSQQPLTTLTSKLKNIPKDQFVVKVESIAKANTSKYAASDIELWKFYILDSLRFRDVSDSIAFRFDENKLKGKFLCESRLMFVKGVNSMDNNAFEEAIKCFFKGAKIASNLKSYKQKAELYRNIGICYMKLEEIANAEKYLTEAFNLTKSINDTLGMANAAISLGNAKKDLGDLKGGAKYYTISLNLAKSLGNARLIAGNYNNMGNIERRLDHPQKALEYFFKALEMNRKSGNRAWESFNLNNIANTYSDIKQYNRSIEYHKLSNEIKNEIGDSINLISSYLGMSEVYASMNDWQDAYQMLKLHNNLKDTLQLAEQVSLLHELEAQYESEKKQLEIEQLTIEKKLDEEINSSLQKESNQNKNLAILSIVSGLIALGGVGVLFRSNKIKKKSNEELNQKNHLIESSHQALEEAMDELSEKNKEIIDSINYATHIQRASLPNMEQQNTAFLQFDLFFAPKDIVSGDFYFSYDLNSRSVFGVGDSTGHGVPGAMVSIVGLNSIEKVVREKSGASSSEFVEAINDYVVESLHRGNENLNDGMDISLCVFNQKTKELEFTGANHTAYVVRTTNITPIDEEVFELRENREDLQLFGIKGTRRPIGKSIQQIPFEKNVVQMKQNDRVILFSDGFPDQIGGGNGKKMKKGAALDLIIQSHTMSLNDQLEFLKSQFYSWKGEYEQVDDVCLMIVEIQ